jgi:glycosyltransferase involved in cell wall biosynthesis
VESEADSQERPLLSVVIPVYGSIGSIDDLHGRLRRALDKITSDWEILFVEDCSPDSCWTKIEGFANEDSRVRAIQLMRNYGQQRAVLCGLAHSEGQFVVTMDDDLQHRPEEIHLLLETLLDSSADVVVGRYRSKKHGLVRRLGTRLVKWVAQKAIGVPPNLSLTSFRIIRRDVAIAVSKIQHSNPVVGYLLFSVTRRFVNVDVDHDARAAGESNYRFRDLLDYFLCMVIDYSDWPLRAVGGVGFLLSMASFAAAALFFYRWSVGAIRVDGFTTIVLLLSLLSGFVLIGLGIIGSYLVRVLRLGGPDSVVAIRTHHNDRD